jgi:hypothetical protein
MREDTGFATAYSDSLFLLVRGMRGVGGVSRVDGPFLLARGMRGVGGVSRADDDPAGLVRLAGTGRCFDGLCVLVGGGRGGRGGGGGGGSLLSLLGSSSTMFSSSRPQRSSSTITSRKGARGSLGDEGGVASNTRCSVSVVAAGQQGAAYVGTTMTLCSGSSLLSSSSASTRLSLAVTADVSDDESAPILLCLHHVGHVVLLDDLHSPSSSRGGWIATTCASRCGTPPSARPFAGGTMTFRFLSADFVFDRRPSLTRVLRPRREFERLLLTRPSPSSRWLDQHNIIAISTKCAERQKCADEGSHTHTRTRTKGLSTRFESSRSVCVRACE